MSTLAIVPVNESHLVLGMVCLIFKKRHKRHMRIFGEDHYDYLAVTEESHSKCGVYNQCKWKQRVSARTLQLNPPMTDVPVSRGDDEPMCHDTKFHDTGEGPAVTIPPRLDWYEDAINNMTEAAFELPGVRLGDVSVRVENGHLVVSGRSQMGLASSSRSGRYRMRERSTGIFKRRLVLPEGITAGDLSARMENGLLLVTYPTKSTPKQIPVAGCQQCA